MTNNISEIYKFGTEWRNSVHFQVDLVGNYFFSAMINYESKLHGRERENCTVHIFRSSMQDGDISIYARGTLQAETHHLGFNSFQKYKFDKNDGALVVTGNSQKMGGNYTVRIVPNGVEPSFL